MADDGWLQLWVRYWQLYQQQWLQQLQLLALETERACLSLLMITMLLLISVVLSLGAWSLLLWLVWQGMVAFGVSEMMATFSLFVLHLLLLMWCRLRIRTYRQWLSFPATRHKFSQAVAPDAGPEATGATESQHAQPQNVENKDG